MTEHIGHWQGTDGKKYDYRAYPRPKPGDDAEDWGPMPTAFAPMNLSLEYSMRIENFDNMKPAIQQQVLKVLKTYGLRDTLSNFGNRVDIYFNNFTDYCAAEEALETLVPILRPKVPSEQTPGLK